jgi:hypothetical protein
LTPFSVSFAGRIRQPSIWIPPSAIVLLYYISSYVHSSHPLTFTGDGRGFVAFALLLGWLIASSGTRDAVKCVALGSINFSSSASLLGTFSYSMTLLGSMAAELVVGVGGAALLALPSHSPDGLGAPRAALLIAVIPVFTSASLQMELALSFAHRSLALILTALLMLATLVHGVAAAPPGLDLVGGLLFPVSGVARAAEEPLGFELAVRATLAGVLYDLALFATLLALRPIRTRDSHEDRDRQ